MTRRSRRRSGGRTTTRWSDLPEDDGLYRVQGPRGDRCLARRDLPGRPSKTFDADEAGVEAARSWRDGAQAASTTDNSPGAITARGVVPSFATAARMCLASMTNPERLRVDRSYVESQLIPYFDPHGALEVEARGSQRCRLYPRVVSPDPNKNGLVVPYTLDPDDPTAVLEYPSGSVGIDQITARRVDGYRVRREDTDGAIRSAVRRDLSLLRRVFDFAIRKGWISENPAEGVKSQTKRRSTAKPIKKRRAFSLETIARLDRHMPNPTLRLALWMYVTLGTRRSELFGLMMGDIDWLTGAYSINKQGGRTFMVLDEDGEETRSDINERTKTDKSERDGYLPACVLALAIEVVIDVHGFDPRLEDPDPLRQADRCELQLLAGPGGQPGRSDRFADILSKAARAEGLTGEFLEFSPSIQWLRTSASRLMDDFGIADRVARDLLGHEDSTMSSTRREHYFPRSAYRDQLAAAAATMNDAILEHVGPLTLHGPTGDSLIRVDSAKDVLGADDNRWAYLLSEGIIRPVDLGIGYVGDSRRAFTHLDDVLAAIASETTRPVKLIDFARAANLEPEAVSALLAAKVLRPYGRGEVRTLIDGDSAECYLTDLAEYARRARTGADCRQSPPLTPEHRGGEVRTPPDEGSAGSDDATFVAEGARGHLPPERTGMAEPVPAAPDAGESGESRPIRPVEPSRDPAPTRQPVEPARVRAVCRECGAGIPIRKRLRCDRCLSSDTAQTPEIRRARGGRIAVTLKANSDWVAAQGGLPYHPHAFEQLILPRLAGFSLQAIMDATGCSKATASLVRRGRVTPHQAMWSSLARLVGIYLPRTDTHHVPASPPADIGADGRPVCEPVAPGVGSHADGEAAA